MAAIREPRGDRNTTPGRIPSGTGSTGSRRVVAARPSRYDRRVREPPITVACDCGQVAYVRYGDRWECPTCGKTWDTCQIPRADYDRLLQTVRRYRLLALGPPLALAAVLVPLAVLVGTQFAFLLFALVLAYGLFALPRIRERASRTVSESTRSWQLSPE